MESMVAPALLGSPVAGVSEQVSPPATPRVAFAEDEIQNAASSQGSSFRPAVQAIRSAPPAIAVRACTRAYKRRTFSCARSELFAMPATAGPERTGIAKLRMALTFGIRSKEQRARRATPMPPEVDALIPGISDAWVSFQSLDTGNTGWLNWEDGADLANIVCLPPKKFTTKSFRFEVGALAAPQHMLSLPHAPNACGCCLQRDLLLSHTACFAVFRQCDRTSKKRRAVQFCCFFEVSGALPGLAAPSGATAGKGHFRAYCSSASRSCRAT